ncbi:MAG: TssN family type VI secretion system protein, partial [Candidatus Azobacteroides sp.]|nr:TssN family type VI secretion system protein [Candidatus Azobacteroides sp.]
MESVIGKFISLYLLLPVAAVILGVVMLFAAKKNRLLNNKRAIFYFLSTVIVLALPGLFGFIDYWFMPDYYLGLSVFYLILGCCYLKILPLMVEGIRDKPYYVEFLIVFVTGLVGAAFFSTVFNLCNELQYGRWACSCMLPFIFP